MPRILLRSPNTNQNASAATRRVQTRAIFANALVQQKTLDFNCLNRVYAGNALPTNYSGSIPGDRREGAMNTTPAEAAAIVAASPCDVPAAAQPPPTYSISCSDDVGVQTLTVADPTVPFLVSPTSEGTGITNFIFKNNVGAILEEQFVVFPIESPIVPPQGTFTIEYVFRCTPVIIQPNCIDSPSGVLEPTLPYSFQNLTGSAFFMTYSKPTEIDQQLVQDNEIFTPIPSYGWTFYSIPCE
jgi:hypothetical protein